MERPVVLRRFPSESAPAFTLVELLVVVGLLLLFTAMLLPAFGRTKQSEQGLFCLNNSRQIMRANQMYQADNGDVLPMVNHSPYSPASNDPNRPWMSGWLDWGRSPEITNVVRLFTPRYSSLAEYFTDGKNLYHCPADTYASPSQRSVGWSFRVRSVSANVYVGKGNGWAVGSWGEPSGPYNLSIYRGAEKSADLLIPGPARTWVYMDENPDSLNDPAAFAPSSSQNMPDAPATFHNGAAGFAMADGHSEMHKWRGNSMLRPRSAGGLAGVNYTQQNNFSMPAGDPDLYWLSFSSPRHTERTVAD